MLNFKKISFVLIFISIIGFTLFVLIGNNNGDIPPDKVEKLPDTIKNKENFILSNVYSQPIPYEVNLNLFPKGLKVEGDFDGNGIIDSIGYNLIKSTREINDEFLINLFLKDSLQKWIWENRPKIHLESDNLKEQIFDNNGWLTGIYSIINEGELNKRPGDEISIVFAKADYSSMNTCHVYSYHKGKWNEISNFSIREWQLPPNDKIDLIKKHGKDSMRIKTFNWEAEVIDTIVEVEFKYTEIK